MISLLRARHPARGVRWEDYTPHQGGLTHLTKLRMRQRHRCNTAIFSFSEAGSSAVFYWLQSRSGTSRLTHLQLRLSIPVSQLVLSAFIAGTALSITYFDRADGDTGRSSGAWGINLRRHSPYRLLVARFDLHHVGLAVELTITSARVRSLMSATVDVTDDLRSITGKRHALHRYPVRTSWRVFVGGTARPTSLTEAVSVGASLI